MDSDEGRQFPLKLEYATPDSGCSITDAAGVYATWLTFGVGVGILFSVAGLVFIHQEGPVSAACLITSPITLLFAFMSCRLGGTFPKTEQAIVIRRAELKWAFIAGFLFPTLSFFNIWLGNEDWLNLTLRKWLTTLWLVALLVGPFWIGAWFVRRSVSPDHLPNQRDDQQ